MTRLAVRQLELEAPGVYVHDLGRIRADAEAGVDGWLPRARVRAVLGSHWQPDCDGYGRTELTVVWFQDPADDPFARLADIVRPLDWRASAVFHVFEPDQ